MFKVLALILLRSCTIRKDEFFSPLTCARYTDALVRSLSPSYLGTKSKFETVFGEWHSCTNPNFSNSSKVYLQYASFSSDMNLCFSEEMCSSISKDTVNPGNFPTSNFEVAKTVWLRSEERV